MVFFFVYLYLKTKLRFLLDQNCSNDIQGIEIVAANDMLAFSFLSVCNNLESDCVDSETNGKA